MRRLPVIHGSVTRRVALQGLAGFRMPAARHPVAPKIPFGTAREIEALLELESQAADFEERAGWGHTTMGDLMREKGADPSAWIWVSSEDSVYDAVRRMAGARIGSLLVFDPEKLRSPIPRVGARKGEGPVPEAGIATLSGSAVASSRPGRPDCLVGAPGSDAPEGVRLTAPPIGASSDASGGVRGSGSPTDEPERCLVHGHLRLAASDSVGLAPLASKDAVVGIITERDYLTKVVVQGRRSQMTTVGSIMTPAASIVSATPQHSVLDVMEMMVARGFRHVPVVDGDNLLGMASMRDVVSVMLREHREEVGRLHEYIQGTL